MNQRPEMSWTCPDCQRRNTSSIPADVEAGKIVDVSCSVCDTAHEASVFFALTQTGALVTLGVVWV
jgi:transcription elongation factor Elf1